MAKYDGTQSLPGALIGRMEQLVKKVCPESVFEYDEASMINVKIDSVNRDKTFIYIEELQQSRIDINKARPMFRVTPIQIYFCRFEPFQNDTWHGDTRKELVSQQKLSVARQAIRDRIENELVLPVIAEINETLSQFTPSYVFRYPIARFDANEVAVLLEVTLTDYICLSHWKKNV